LAITSLAVVVVTGESYSGTPGAPSILFYLKCMLWSIYNYDNENEPPASMFVSRHSAVGPPSRTELLCMNSDVMLVFKINYSLRWSANIIRCSVAA